MSLDYDENNYDAEDPTSKIRKAASAKSLPVTIEKDHVRQKS